MSETREKLMKLLCTVSCESELEGELGSCPYRKGGKCAEVERLDYCAMQKLADHLLANGVTVQKWIPVSERLPETQEEVLTYSECNGVRAGSLIVANGETMLWYLCRTDKLSMAVTHWMPLPEPPKEEA